MTPFTDIYELALTVIEDYRLNILASTQYQSFLRQMQNILVKSIPYFSGCMTSLEYTLSDPTSTTDTSYFNETLSMSEKNILADYMVLTWFRKVTNDVTQINEGLQGRDKKNNAKSSNLKEKAKYLIDLKEKVRQSVSDYQLENFDEVFS